MNNRKESVSKETHSLSSGLHTTIVKIGYGPVMRILRSFLMEGRHSVACLKICDVVSVRGHTATGWTG